MTRRRPKFRVGQVVAFKRKTFLEGKWQTHYGRIIKRFWGPEQLYWITKHWGGFVSRRMVYRNYTWGYYLEHETNRVWERHMRRLSKKEARW